MTSRRELYGGQDDLNPDEPRDQVRITGREYLRAQEFDFFPNARPPEAIIGCGFYEYISALQRKGVIKPFEGTVNEKMPIEVWRDLEGALYKVFTIELHRDCGINLNPEMVEKGWGYYQNM